ncbi:Aldehyde dehydrogenase [Exophiala dermatitidis]
MDFQTGLFIDGKYVSSSTNETLSVVNPYDKKVVAEMQCASETDVNNAVHAAARAFPAWKATSGSQRTAMMNKLADLIEENIEKLAKLESLSMGQPVSTAKRFIAGSFSLWRYYAGYAGKVTGDTFPVEDGMYKIVKYEPLGVCAGICAWNASHLLAAWKLAPAVAAGNTCVIKSSEKSPLSLAQYGKLLNLAGFPAGVINILTGDGRVGAQLASHMDIAKISFTGSIATGRAVQIAAAKSNLKKVTLELGGKSPAIVFADADIENAVHNTSIGFLRNSGQVCVAASRILVQEDIFQKFAERLKEAYLAAATQMGDPSLDETEYGPLADEKQHQNVLRFLEDSKKEGIQVLAGDEARTSKADNSFVYPTVLFKPHLNSSAYTQEIFGPVVCLNSFKDEEEAVMLANNTPYGLGSAIYTSDITRALRIADRIESGMVGINSAFASNAQTPFGGWKQSGYGREGGLEGIKNYLQTKTIHINLNMTAQH